MHLWQETQKREVYLCLTEVLGEGSFKDYVVKLKKELTIEMLESLRKETWIQTDLGLRTHSLP